MEMLPKRGEWGVSQIAQPSLELLTDMFDSLELKNRPWPELPLGYALAVLLAVSVCEIIAAIDISEAGQNATLALLRTVELILIAALVWRFRLIDSLGLVMPDRRAWRLFFMIAAFCALMFMTALLVSFVMDFPFLIYFVSPNFISGVSGVLLMLLLAPVVEELFFRGLVYRLFEQSFGLFAAIALSAVCFALMHGQLFSPQLAGGLIFAIAYQFSRNLWVSMALHAGGNATVLFISAMLST